MEWLLIILLALAVFLNIRAIIAINRTKQEKQEVQNDLAHINQNMEKFAKKLEKENDILYQKMTEYIKIKERDFEKRIYHFEQKLEEDSISPLNEAKSAELDLTGKSINDHLLAQNETNHDKAWALYRQGFSSKQIAKILKVEHGKIELVINMQKKRKANNDEMK